jgi:hypothetical protein
VARLVDHHLLVILIERGHADRAGEHDVGALRGIGDLVDALPCRELPQLEQRAQQTKLFIVQKPKQRHVSQFFLFARHASPSYRNRCERQYQEKGCLIYRWKPKSKLAYPAWRSDAKAIEGHVAKVIEGHVWVGMRSLGGLRGRSIRIDWQHSI